MENSKKSASLCVLAFVLGLLMATTLDVLQPTKLRYILVEEKLLLAQ